MGAKKVYYLSYYGTKQGAMVTKDISEDKCVGAGVPARIIERY